MYVADDSTSQATLPAMYMCIFQWIWIDWNWLNLDYSVAEMIKLVMVVSICSSYAMQFYVPIPIIWPSISKHFSFIGNDTVAEYIFRTILVILICKIT